MSTGRKPESCVSGNGRQRDRLSQKEMAVTANVPDQRQLYVGLQNPEELQPTDEGGEMIIQNINHLVDEGAVDHALLLESLYYNPETGNFSARNTGKIRSFMQDNGYICLGYKGKKWLAHRLAWFYMKGKWPSNEIDHINGNTSDNRIRNLREATRLQNAHNRRLGKNNTSGARCVFYERGSGKWGVHISRFGHKFWLGKYEDKQEAIDVANEFLKKSDGEFFSAVTATRNLPQDQIALLAFIKKRTDLDSEHGVDRAQRAWSSSMLSGWGKWAYEGLEGRTKISPIGRFMESVSGRGAITSDGIVAIVEGLHQRGFTGSELINKASQIIANLKHVDTDKCTDEEGMFIDRIIMKALGKNSPLLKVAVNHYVYGHRMETIAQYLQKITSGALTIPQARDRVRWCIRIIEARMYKAIHRELDKYEEEELKVA